MSPTLLLDLRLEAGYTFATIGSQSKAMVDDRVLKANRASFWLKQDLSSQGNIDVGLATYLFDKMISPILLYGCSFWGIPNKTKLFCVNNVQENVNCTQQIHYPFLILQKDKEKISQ